LKCIDPTLSGVDLILTNQGTLHYRAGLENCRAPIFKATSRHKATTMTTAIGIGLCQALDIHTNHFFSRGLDFCEDHGNANKTRKIHHFKGFSIVRCQ
jgi:hypothetical protein